MLDYLSLKSDIENIDGLIQSCTNFSAITKPQIAKLKSLAGKASSGDRSSLKEFRTFLEEFNGLSVEECIKLVNAKGNLVSKQKDLLFQSSNAILFDDLGILLKFIISELGETYDIKFDNSEELSNPTYWKYKFNKHKKAMGN